MVRLLSMARMRSRALSTSSRASGSRALMCPSITGLPMIMSRLRRMDWWGRTGERGPYWLPTNTGRMTTSRAVIVTTGLWISPRQAVSIRALSTVHHLTCWLAAPSMPPRTLLRILSIIAIMGLQQTFIQVRASTAHL